MNKRANLYLNIYGSITFLLSILGIGYSLTLKELSYEVPSIFHISIMIIGVIAGLIYISIELFLFLLLKKTVKGIEIIFTLVSLLIAIFINSMIPFSGYLIIILLGLGLDISRVLLVDSIYIPKEFNRYCKMFNISIKDFPKKKNKTQSSERKEVIKIPKEEIIEKGNQKKKVNHKKTKKEATI